jgi:DNA-binding CsgD family transcriptional regulator/uncharacterized glyoxalase superfamily protein PhnB
MASTPYSRIGRPRHPDVLTSAEWEVLAGIRDGRSNREIAADRSCDIETIRFHLKNIRRKLGVHSRDELRAFPGRPANLIEHARGRKSGPRIREQIPLVHTRDMGSALDFYVGALDFEIVSRWPDDGELPRWAALGAGGARLMLRAGHPRRAVTHTGRPGVVTLNLYVEGLDAFRAQLIGAGYRCGKPEALFYGAREFYLLDPDSNEIAIVEFAASEPRYITSGGSHPRPLPDVPARRPKPRKKSRPKR